MKINVIGATGQLGGRIVKELLRQGGPDVQVIASARNPAKARGRFGDQVEIRHADYDAPATLKSSFAGCDVVGLVPTFAPVEARVQQHAAALAAAKEAGVARVVFSSVSTAAVESEFVVAPFIVYAECKLRQSEMGWTILRNGMYADPLADYVPELVKTGRIPYPAGQGRINYVCRDDLARATAAACLSDASAGRVFELTGPEAISVAELAEIVSRVTGKPVQYDPASESDFADMCRGPGVPEYLPHAFATMYRAVARGEFDKVTDHIEELTGAPAEGVEAYLRRSLNPA